MKNLLMTLLCVLIPTFAHSAALSVFAASSLTGALTEIAQSYEARSPQHSVVLHFAGSQLLATQIRQGAPADLFISANDAAMRTLTDAERVETPLLLARNQLSIAFVAQLDPPLRSLRDLARPGLILAIGNPQVPIGRYTREFFKRLAQNSADGPQIVSAIRQNVVTQENQVKAIVAKLLLGEVDAGIVYQSDLYGTPLASLGLPQEFNPQARYPAAVVRNGQTEEARNFLDFLRSTEGQKILTHYGLLTATEEP